MLALDRPFGVVANLALFADHADKRRVYYVPTRPRMARVDGAQEMSFVRFRSDDAADGGAGLLSFTTELVATDPQLDAAREHVQRLGVSDAMLVQVPWIGGKAVFAAALEEGDGFVEKLLGETTPDLAATNRAMFSLRLSEEGARLIEALVTMEGPSPLGVRYELKYAGLQPALQVRIHADYKRIYDELSWGLQFGVAYEGIGVRASVESATQKLIEAGAIRIEVLHFTDSAALKQRVDAGVRWVQDRILEDFFKTSLQPARHENLLQKALDAAQRLGAQSLQDALGNVQIVEQLAQELGIPVDALRRLGQGANAASGGGGMPGGGAGGGAGGAANQSSFALKLQFTLRDIHQEELKTISFDWSEAHAQERTAAPQGLLSQLGAAPKIVDADDSGTFWDKLDVNVRALGDFNALGVRRLVVQLAYPDENQPDAQRALTFEPGEAGPKPFSAWTNGKPPRYRARTEVQFDEDGAWPGPPIHTSAWQTQQSLELALHPLSEVPRVEIEISPGTLSFGETPQVQVDLRIDGKPAATHWLTEAEPTARFRQRLAAAPAAADAGAPAVPSRVEARITWFLAGGGKVEGDWQVVDGTALLVHRPWRSTRSVRLVPLLPDDFIEAMVTLSIVEPAHAQSIEQRFEAGDRRSRAVGIPCLAEQAPPVRIDTLVIRGDGSSFVAPSIETSDPVVVIRDREGRHRQVGVRLLAAPSLQTHALIAVQVQLLDVAGAVQDEVVFTESRREPGLLLVPVEADGTAPSVRVIRYRLDGTATVPTEQALPTSSSEFLVPAEAAA